MPFRLFMRPLLLILAASSCTVPVQGKTAEETFMNIEGMLEKAKSLTVRARFLTDLTLNETAQRLEGPATLLLKDGNRVHFSMKYPKAGEGKEIILIYDGSRVAWKSETGWEPTVSASKRFESNLRVILARAGLGGPPGTANAPWLFLAQLDNDFKKLCAVTDFKHGGGEGSARTLTYQLVDFDLAEGFAKKETEARIAEVKLWYDAGSNLPLKRTVTFKNPRANGTLTEVYDEFVLDSPIPDEKFKLPGQ